MNNIEILEKMLEREKECLHYDISQNEVQALENLIQENKELKRKLQEHISIEAHEQVKQLYIPKSKILNFINNELPDDEICECCSNYDVNGVRLKNELKKLLEEGE